MVILGCILLFFIFLLTLKATVTVEYSGEVALYVRVLFVKIRVLPSKEKKYPRSMNAKKAARLKAKLEKKEQKKRAKKAEKKRQKDEKKQAIARGELKKEKKSAGEIVDIVSLVCDLVKKVVSRFFGHLRIKLTRIKLKIGTGDAAATALTYGAVTQSINVLFPLLEGIKQVKFPKGDQIDITPDFTAEESEIDIRISFSLRVWHLFHVAFAALGRLIKYFFQSQKRKAEKQ